MGRRRKFTDLELGEALRAGLSKEEMCARWQVSRQAIEQRCAKLDLAAGQMALLHQGKDISRQAVDAQGQLLKISEVANRWLDYLDGVMVSKPTAAVAGVMAVLEQLRPELSEEAGALVDASLTALSRLKHLELQVLDRIGMLMAEIRKQLELMVKAAADLVEAKRMAAAQQAIIEEIGRESPECKARIIRRLGGLQGPGLLFGADGWA